jgi:hypothetical protein
MEMIRAILGIVLWAKFAMPQKESITYVLSPALALGANPDTVRRQSVTISIKWMGMYQDGVQSIREAVDAALAEADKKTWYEDEDRIRKRIHELMGVSLTQKMLTTTKYSNAEAKIQSLALKSVPVADPSGVAYGDYSDDVGILKVSTFGPPDMQTFRSRVEEAMHTFSLTDKDHSKKLIVDLRSNGGGDICLGYGLHRYLFPQTHVNTNGHGPHSMARYDMIKSDLFSEMAVKGAEMLATTPQSQLACGQDPEVVGYFTPCAWFNGANSGSMAVKSSNVMVSDGDWMSSGAVSRTRGGVTAEYSGLIHEGCEVEYSKWAPPGAGFGGVSPENVILLSDGLCGSTCSVFSSSVQLRGLAKTVVVGGFHNSDQLFWSFPGGEVETIEFLVSTAQILGISSANVPQILPDGATFRFAIREIYPWDTAFGLGSSDNADFVPLEFVNYASDYRIYYNSVYSDSAAVIDQVVPLFKSPSCPAKGYRSAVTGKCSTCPPGSSANKLGTGCECEYGVWSASAEACGFDRKSALTAMETPTIEVVSAVTAFVEVPVPVGVVAIADMSNCEEQVIEVYTGPSKVAVIGVACTSFVTGIVATVVFFYLAVTRDERRAKPQTSRVELL